MPVTELDSFRCYFEDTGQGWPLVFLHGFSLDHRMWQPQVSFFRDDYRVICPDARGHGRSEVTSTGYSRADRVEDLADLVNSLGIERFHLVGLSMGGTTAIGYALSYPERLMSLTLVSTGAAGYSVGGKMSRLDRLARTEGVRVARQKWMEWSLAWYKGDRARLGVFLESIMREYSGSVWADPMRGKYPRENDLDNVHRINVPCRIFAGELDRVFVPLAQALQERIRGSELSIYENAGHMLNLEFPRQFNDDLKAFLEMVPGRY